MSPSMKSAITEWDTTRRTAEFFDDQLGRLREVDVASSVAIIGIAVQFNLALGLVLVPLNAVFWEMDKRFQRYLDLVTRYAAKLEDTHEFTQEGLTTFIQNTLGKTKKSSMRKVMRYAFVTFIATGLILAAASPVFLATYKWLLTILFP